MQYARVDHYYAFYVRGYHGMNITSNSNIMHNTPS